MMENVNEGTNGKLGRGVHKVVRGPLKEAFGKGEKLQDTRGLETSQ